MSLGEALTTYFGHDEFRPGQEQVIQCLLEGRSSLAVFPTGGGKSLCYQLPALLMEGLTLVVSPLIALMKDQVDVLQSKGIAAARLDSTLTAGEASEIYSQMRSGQLQLLYVAPERLANEGFLNRLRQCSIAMLAVDEAHCISEWGHNFRPDYLKLAKLAEQLAIPRVLALTATATPRVSTEICSRFGINPSDHIQTGFARPNLTFSVTPAESSLRDGLLWERLTRNPAGPTVIYTTLQRTAESVATFLIGKGLQARAYHAGMRDEDRSEVQEGFMRDEIQIVVATIAFGMGIDKANIRYVYHYNLPKSIENYVQEAGRAGRDGEPAFCEILGCHDDLTVLENFVYGDTPSRSALQSLVEHVLKQGEEFSISRYDLSGSKDLRPIVVATALTYLELDGALQATGPFYSGYQFKFLQARGNIIAGHTPDRQEFLNRIFDSCQIGRIWRKCEIDVLAETTREDPLRIRNALNYLADLGDIELRPTGLRHGYRLSEKAALGTAYWTDKLIALFENREKGEIARLGQVVGLCESGDCIASSLLRYFGEEPASDCGKCSACTGQYTGGTLPGRLGEGFSLDQKQIEIIHSMHQEGHSALRQARQLARFLCGLRSPATTRARLMSDDRFGIFEEIPFQEVLLQVESMGI